MCALRVVELSMVRREKTNGKRWDVQSPRSVRRIAFFWGRHRALIKCKAHSVASSSTRCIAPFTRLMLLHVPNMRSATSILPIHRRLHVATPRAASMPCINPLAGGLRAFFFVSLYDSTL